MLFRKLKFLQYSISAKVKVFVFQSFCFTNEHQIDLFIKIYYADLSTFLHLCDTLPTYSISRILNSLYEGFGDERENVFEKRLYGRKEVTRQG